MAVTTYEGLFIIDSNRYHRDGAAIIKGIEQILTSAGGELLVSRMWDERRLAYAVDGHRKGVYWLIYFQVHGPSVTEMNTKLKIQEDLLRYMLIKLDPRVAPAMVEHARAGGMVAPAKNLGDLKAAVDDTAELPEAVEIE